TQATPHELEQAALEGMMRFPKLSRVDLVDLLPHRRVAHAVAPGVSQAAVVELLHGGADPTWDVHPIGNVTDGELFFQPPGPRVGPHPPRDVTMKRAHGVGTTRKLEPDDCHAGWLMLVLRLVSPQSHELFMGNVQLVAQRPNMLFN